MKNNSDKKPRLRYDVILIAVLLLFAIFSLALMLATRTEGAYAEVAIDGMTVAVYPLDKDAEYELNGGTNVLVIKGGEAYLTYADCPDKTCVNTGRIRYSGESIICLPNKLTVTIIGKMSGEVDFVS